MYRSGIRQWRRLVAFQQQCSHSLRAAQKRYQTTYFQQPPSPKSRPWRGLLIGTGGFASGAVLTWYLGKTLDMEYLQQIDTSLLEFADLASQALITEYLATVNMVTTAMGTYVLNAGSGEGSTPGTILHYTQLPSNFPMEDAIFSLGKQLNHDPDRIWTGIGICDGHAGGHTSRFLVQNLFPMVTTELENADCFRRDYVPNDPVTLNAIKRGFTALDDIILNTFKSLAESNHPRSVVLTSAYAAYAGSCALFALFDPYNRVLRVANVGDSRAVLGRWDSRQGKYVAYALSNDHTGFNSNEVARLNAEHPGEDVVDPKTGRVFGLAVTRAFGDSRWKWPAAVTQLAHERFWGPAPRPKGVVKTPPYLTAEPEITETMIETEGSHPDFLIMASDGFWDVFDNQDAVTCVQLWLDKFSPKDALNPRDAESDLEELRASLEGSPTPTQPSTDMIQFGPPKLSTEGGDDDTYFDETERCLKWRVSPRYFVVEDAHCGVHLVKNALGGSRRALFEAVMSTRPPNSRDVRDDISVQVAFFNNDIIGPEAGRTTY